MPGALTLKGGPDYKKYQFDTFEFRRVNQNDTIFAPTNGNVVIDYKFGNDPTRLDMEASGGATYY